MLWRGVGAGGQAAGLMLATCTAACVYKLAPGVCQHCSNASFASPLVPWRRYGFQPHRVALWIYWQAVLLLWKGVPFYG